MKIAALFAKFLYQHKQLRLPGIGVFTIDPSVPIPEATDKNFGDFTQHIRFVQQPVEHADEEFINFIRTETGKIKPLAESDLDSFLSDGKILLNIGKPFQFEGIGQILKNREGVYIFTPGQPELHRPEHTTHEKSDDGPKGRSFYADNQPQQNNLRKVLIGAAAIAGIILIVWGGYSLYNRNTHSNAPIDETVIVAPSDADRAAAINDSVHKIIDSTRKAAISQTTTAPGTYKFVIERTKNKNRAYKRYNQIKENLTDIRLESKDSVEFNLYFILPAQPTDTTRIKDSLKIWYGRKQVFIEQP